MQPITMTTAPTHWAHIYIAGDLAVARQACREHCHRVGLCVTVEPVDYVFTGGAESGVRVGLINYPRFPACPAEIDSKVDLLARFLLDRLCQLSCSIVTPESTIWLTRRPDE